MDQAAVLLLRLLHVIGGAIWVGIIFFNTVFLMPTLQELGPDGGKVQAGLQRRGLLNFLPAVALVTVLSGVALYWRSSAGFQADYLKSGPGLAFGLGGLAAIVGYSVGILVMRPAILRAMALAQSLPAAKDDAERGAIQATVGQLRARAGAAAKVVLALLLISTAAMAVGRFV